MASPRHWSKAARVWGDSIYIRSSGFGSKTEPFHVCQYSTLECGSLNACACEICIAQVGTVELGMFQIRAVEAGTFQLCKAEGDVTQPGATEVGTVELRGDELCAKHSHGLVGHHHRHVGAGEVRPTHVVKAE